MLRLCEVAAAKNKRVYFYGSSDDVLAKLKQKLLEAYPTLQIVGMHSPEHKADVQTETVSKIAEINALKPDYIFVGLGCPKQEIWMYRHANLFPDSVLLGVGAAFNFHAGTVKRAPEWMRNSGLEWLFRLIQEPRRLWKRYLVTGFDTFLFVR
jgi:N-acetylglucosaminyldiphosphoundecaprenol N-acetyl-beta-D-mannosaminyltransferase